MKSNIRFILFSVLTLILTAVIFQPVVRNSRTLLLGEEFRFMMRPVDPVDFFRGRYVTLNFPAASVPVQFHGDTVHISKSMFAVLKQDSLGYSTVKYLTSKRPKEPSVRVELYNSGAALPREGDEEFTTETFSFSYPFTRYYMHEKDAPVAETIYRREIRENPTETYLAVRIHKGHAVIRELYLNGEAVKDAVKRENRK